MILLVILLCIMTGVLSGRLYQLQISDSRYYREELNNMMSREEQTPASRGTIYDRNGIPLAFDEAAYNILIEDSETYGSLAERNRNLNSILQRTLTYIEENGDEVERYLSIAYSEQDGYSFTVTGEEQERFLADIFGHASTEDLGYNTVLGINERNADALQIMAYLCSNDRYGIGSEYTPEEALEIAGIRYALSLNSYQRYVPVTIARDVSEETVSVITENAESMEGISIEENTIRRYADGEYFSHLLGYTGLISEEEYEELSAEDPSYSRNDMVGKSGIEAYMETELQGQKGIRRFYVDSMGRRIQNIDETEPIAGNDVYLTINAELQETVYNMIERELADILSQNLVPGELDSGTENDNDLQITTDEVCFALIDNSLLDIGHFSREDAGIAETYLYDRYASQEERFMEELPMILDDQYNDLDSGVRDILDRIVDMLQERNIFLPDEETQEDDIYQQWVDGKISLYDLIGREIEEGRITQDAFKLQESYSTSSDLQNVLNEWLREQLPIDEEFQKLIYEQLIREGNIDVRQICRALYEQGILEMDEMYRELLSGETSVYDFLRDKISTIQITPAELALDPCTGSSVVTDPETGQVLACVTYPGYDNSRFANSIDSEYYNQLLEDNSLPLYNNATQQRTAPGSTFKPVTAVAGLTEGVITTSERILDEGRFDRVDPSPVCWIYPSNHGWENVSEAIRDSCNYFFYETAYRLSGGTEEGNSLDIEQGIERLSFYAEMLGLGSSTGIQMPESEPRVADEYPITAAIGQSNHGYTTTQLARYAGTLATRGNVYSLNLIDRIEAFDGTVLSEQTPVLERTAEGISDSTWDAVQRGMEMVGQSNRILSGLPFQVAGKTGTAQESASRPDHALFLGYAPADNPEIAVATRIAYGYSSTNATELAANIMRYYIG